MGEIFFHSGSSEPMRTECGEICHLGPFRSQLQRLLTSRVVSRSFRGNKYATWPLRLKSAQGQPSRNRVPKVFASHERLSYEALCRLDTFRLFRKLSGEQGTLGLSAIQ